MAMVMIDLYRQESEREWDKRAKTCAQDLCCDLRINGFALPDGAEEWMVIVLQQHLVAAYLCGVENAKPR
jgi:hypothetical protein